MPGRFFCRFLPMLFLTYATVSPFLPGDFRTFFRTR